ncbi:DUF1361 domain-containing protein [soil metagenome]
MAYLQFLLDGIADVVRANRFWMAWNLILAVVPAVLAIVLLARPHRRTIVWWAGVAVFVAFLPNAPYVITDLIHLRRDAAGAASDGVLVFGVLPLYAGFVLAGFLAYLVCTELVAREVRSVRPGTRRWVVELALHLLCALGIVLGRIARLNSWDTITQPVGTAEQIFTTLTWRGAPAAFVAVFVGVACTHLVLRTLVVAAAEGARSAHRRRAGDAATAAA